MTKLVNNQNVKAILLNLLELAACVAVVFLLASVPQLSNLGGSLMMKTGVLNVETDEREFKETPFDYEFQIQDLGGKEIHFSEFKGKVVFLNLWATWCGPCRVEMPEIQALFNHADTTRIKFVMLSLDTDENHDKVVKYIEDKKYTFPVYQPLGYLPKQLKVHSIPTTFVVGADGKIKSKTVGMTNFNTDEFKEFLRSLGEAVK